MTTLGIMAERIADELRRDDLSTATEVRVLDAKSGIEDAIRSAIRKYRGERFYFSQSRSDVVFSTVAGQDKYTKTDLAAIDRITKIHYGFVTISGFAHRLIPMEQERIEAANLGSSALVSQPAFYSYFAQTITIEPIPSDVWALRFGCDMRAAAPATSSEADNPWMVEAFDLIRWHAKALLYADVIKDAEKAQQYFSLAADARQTLIDETNDRASPETAEVVPWDPF